MSNQSTVDHTELSLDSVFKTLTHWRSNKQNYDNPGIPEKIWVSVFKLEDQGYPKKDLRRLFGLNSEQYKKKRYQHYPTVEKTSEPNPVKGDLNLKQNVALQFSEAIVTDQAAETPIPPLAHAAQQTKQAIKKLKSPDNQPERYLDQTTVIVECIRPDGHRLKIHTTNNRLDVVMQHFFSQEAAL